MHSLPKYNTASCANRTRGIAAGGENPSGIRQGGATAVGGPLGGAHHTSPINFPGSKSKIKKNIKTLYTTFFTILMF
mgnify:CR=1 FL=1